MKRIGYNLPLINVRAREAGSFKFDFFGWIGGGSNVMWAPCGIIPRSTKLIIPRLASSDVNGTG